MAGTSAELTAGVTPERRARIEPRKAALRQEMDRAVFPERAVSIRTVSSLTDGDGRRKP